MLDLNDIFHSFSYRVSLKNNKRTKNSLNLPLYIASQNCVLCEYLISLRDNF